MSKRENPLTPEILLAILERSSLLNVLIEGVDDSNVYRNFEKKIGIRSLSFLNCGGRAALLKIYERRNELANKKILFIADRDMWVFSSVPTQYSDIVFTNGYSIENDLYADGRSLLKPLFSPSELDKFDMILNEVVEWFAFEVDKCFNNQAYDAKFSDISILSTKNFDRTQLKFTEDFIKNRGLTPPKTDTKEAILSSYQKKLRGKFIFQIIELLFQIREGSGVSYTKLQLFDLCFSEYTRHPNSCPNIEKIITELNNFAMN